jgi:catechol 2,3-dioxygenase-like lactoylglutathione lyase family enzyme
MGALDAKAIVPFVPSGADYDLARRFFADLGFVEVWENDGYAGFRNGGAEFILQRFDDERFAQNLMLSIIVDDLEAWWGEAASKQLEAAYRGFRINAPKDFPWGREVHFIDPAGVCWHVRGQ